MKRDSQTPAANVVISRGRAPSGDPWPLMRRGGSSCPTTKSLLIVFAMCGMLLGVPGCGFLSKLPGKLPQAIAYVQDTETALQLIDGTVQGIFQLTHTSQKVIDAYNKYRNIILLQCDFVTQAAQAGEDISSKDVIAAFAKIEAAYKDLVATLHQAGINVGAKLPVGSKPGEHAVIVPTPLIVSHDMGHPQP